MSEPIDLDALKHYMRESQARGFTHAGNPLMWLPLIAELRASRKVVEAAREYRNTRHKGRSGPVDLGQLGHDEDALFAAVAELEALK